MLKIRVSNNEAKFFATTLFPRKVVFVIWFRILIQRIPKNRTSCRQISSPNERCKFNILLLLPSKTKYLNLFHHIFLFLPSIIHKYKYASCLITAYLGLFCNDLYVKHLFGYLVFVILKRGNLQQLLRCTDVHCIITAGVFGTCAANIRVLSWINKSIII